MTSAPTLTDGTVTIRALRASDAPGVHEQCVDPLSVAWTNVPVPHTPEMAHDFCTRRAAAVWADGSEWIFAVEADGRYAGNVALRDEGLGRAEIAFGSHPDARGTGVTERALRLLLAWGFDQQGLQTVVWRANVGNWASRRLAWRLGFSFDGLLRRSQPFRGRLVDGWLGTLLADDVRSPTTTWFRVPELVGDDVRLRPFSEEDVPRIVEASNDERTRHWLGRTPSPYTEAHAATWLAGDLEAQATGESLTWALTDVDADVALGSINVFDLTPGVECEIGYWTHPDARGRGLMTAALRLVTTYAFGALGVQRVRATAALDNAASRHVMEAAGFRQFGEERLATVLRTGRADVARYDVVLGEWAAASVAAASVRR